MELEEAGNQQYQSNHMAKLFEEGFSFSGFERDKLYLNDGGQQFIDLSGLSGLDSVSDGRGAAYADFDNDGDYDIFLTALQGQVHHLFRNNVGSENGNFLRVSLRGAASGKDAYGAVVRLKTSQGVLTRLKAGGSGFVSQSDPRLLFGLGSDKSIEGLEVSWPSGTVQRFDSSAVEMSTDLAGASIRIVEGSSQIEFVDESRFSLPDPVPPGDVVFEALRPRRGDLFPALPLVDMEGQQTDFASFRQEGRSYLVNLWATWCVPCRQEMPELEKLIPEFAAAGVELIGISLDTGTARDRVPRFLVRAGITYPNFTTEESSFEALFSGGQIFVPVSFIVDERGHIADIFSGWSRDSEAKIRSLIR